MQSSLPVWDTIVEAWNKTYGAKASFWGALGIIVAIAIGFLILEKNIPAASWLLSLIENVIDILLRAGAIYMGILWARNQPMNYSHVFRAFNLDMGWKIILATILQTLIILPIMLIAGISLIYVFINSAISTAIAIVCIIAITYLAIRMSLSLCYIVDRGIGAWESIKLSFHATRNHVWALFGITLLFGCLFIISALPLGIGLIWTLPCSFVLYGLVYQKLTS